VLKANPPYGCLLLSGSHRFLLRVGGHVGMIGEKSVRTGGIVKNTFLEGIAGIALGPA